MSCSYAEGLSAYENKGKLGEPETFDSKEELARKIRLLSQWIEESKHVVLHTGAGISTSAGIPDFRGPNGVWTLEKKGIKPKINISFDDAVPTPTHMAITELVKQNKVHYIVSQNIDGLHLRSGLSRKHLAELHGNMYVDQCNKCDRQFVRKTATHSVGQKNLHISCPYQGYRPCRGTLHDTILDWEHNLPQKDINLGDYNSSIADLSICLGTTLQINPSGMLPTYTKKYNQGKLVICNLSSTKHDKKADLLIRGYVDDILSGVMKHLNLPIPEYNEKQDPSRTQDRPYQVEWTQQQSDVLKVKRNYEAKMRDNKKRKLSLKNKTDDEDEICDNKMLFKNPSNAKCKCKYILHFASCIFHLAF
uniref:protein acetyllysine N-acetyltransferase n=1 Tax=Cacopsylla melanoneura TaxID=428564 RepID=A0A8D8LVJ1_9HEMI